MKNKTEWFKTPLILSTQSPLKGNGEATPIAA